MASTTVSESEAPGKSEAPRVFLLDVAGPEVDRVRVFGLTARERLERNLRRAGVIHIERLASDGAGRSFGASDETVDSRHPDAAAAAGAAPEVSPDEVCLAFRSDCFYDERLVVAMVEGGPEGVVSADAGEGRPSAVALRAQAARLPDGLSLLRSGEEPAEGSPLARLATVDVAPAYNKALRKYDPPFVCRVDPKTRGGVEKRLFASSYKGITDLVTKWVWPLPARLVVGALARRGVTPNAVTYVSYVLTALATWWFAVGAFEAGLVAAWIMTFLDTVDGKLARVTITSTKYGDVLDHGLDLVHPPIWWFAWAWGIGLAQHELAMWVVVGGYVVGRLLEGVFLAAFQQELFTWRPFDAFFRTIIARRNPNLLLLTAGTLAGRPDWGFIAVAVWTAVCLVVPVVRIVQAFGQRRSGVPIRSFHEQAEHEAAAYEGAAGGARRTP